MDSRVMERPVHEMTETDQLWHLYRQVRGSYQMVCRLLVERGVLAEMPRDLDKPIKVG